MMYFIILTSVVKVAIATTLIWSVLIGETMTWWWLTRVTTSVMVEKYLPMKMVRTLARIDICAWWTRWFVLAWRLRYWCFLQHQSTIVSTIWKISCSWPMRERLMPSTSCYPPSVVLTMFSVRHKQPIIYGQTSHPRSALLSACWECSALISLNFWMLSPLPVVANIFSNITTLRILALSQNA